MLESKQIAKDKKGFHCGENVDEETYELDSNSLCCIGCQTVYQILNESNLHQYYRYNQHPGKAQKGAKADLSYLDEPNIAAKLVDYRDDDVTIITFYIPVIHCSSCIWLLENLYKLHAGVKSSQVDFMKKQTSVTFKHEEISLRQVVDLLVQ